MSLVVAYMVFSGERERFNRFSSDLITPGGVRQPGLIQKVDETEGGKWLLRGLIEVCRHGQKVN